ncbi:hypothetical protein VNI00_006427 [Paramarasmius palmivorus]|uniref:F-box protein n=1 Tax=Paramarasmius palmivorus TaxID=297713 RepID=A0AAW0DB82_9AGAR
MSSEIPLEITEKIISSLWLSTLSPSHRVTFIKSSHLVSKTWNAVFSRVAARDVHILSDSHGLWFLDIFGGNSCLCYPLDHLCRSITFEHEYKYLLPGPEKNEQLLGRVINEILRVIFVSPDRLPHLRRIALLVKNFLTETIFEHHPFLHMPYQVRELDINFSYGEETNPLTIQAIKSRRSDKYNIPHGSLSFVKRLRVKGTSSGIAEELLGACGGKERLLVFEQDAWKEQRPFCPVILLPVYEDGSCSSDEDSGDEEEEEEFHDCEEEYGAEKGGNSWSGCEKLFMEDFSKDELSRLLLAFQRQLLTT